MGVFNTKYGGGGMILSPYSVVNDGLIEILLYTEKIGFKGLVGVMDDASKHLGI